MIDKIYKYRNKIYTCKSLHDEYLLDDGGISCFAKYVEWLQEDGLIIMTRPETAADLLLNSLSFRAVNYNINYLEGVMYRSFEGNWGYRPWAPGNYCPECRSMSCSGCWEWRAVTLATAGMLLMDMLRDDYAFEAVQWL